MTCMFPVPFCMFSATNLLNMLLISGIKRIIGTKIGVNNLESLYWQKMLRYYILK